MKHIFLNLMVILDIMLRVHLQILGKCKKVPRHKISKALLSAFLPLPRRIQRATWPSIWRYIVVDLLCAEPSFTVFHTANIQGVGYSRHMSKETGA